MKNIKTLTDKNHEEFVINSSKLILIDFSAEWCGPCKAIAPIVEELATEFIDTVDIMKCDVDENVIMASLY